MQTRNCNRCGRDFLGPSYGRVCLACQTPRTRPLRKRGELSARELQIIALVAQGHANKEIAAQLYLTEGTIKKFMGRIFRKLGIKSRVSLTIWHMTRPIEVRNS